MNVFIIGCGYVGKRAAQLWKKQGRSVTATTRSKDKIPDLQPYADKVILMESIQNEISQADIILLSVAPGKGGDYRKTYLETAQNLVSLAKPRQQIIYTGSTSVYGEAEGKWVAENSQLNPAHPNSKILIETELELLKHPKTCILRIGEILGPQRTLEDRLRHISGKELPGSGENPTNWIHVDDIIRALDLAAKKQLTGIYNLCNDEHVPRKEVYQSKCRQYGLAKPAWNPEKTSPFGGSKKVSNNKIKQAGLKNFIQLLSFAQILLLGLY